MLAVAKMKRFLIIYAFCIAHVVCAALGELSSEKDCFLSEEMPLCLGTELSGSAALNLLTPVSQKEADSDWGDFLRSLNAYNDPLLEHQGCFNLDVMHDSAFSTEADMRVHETCPTDFMDTEDDTPDNELLSSDKDTPPTLKMEEANVLCHTDELCDVEEQRIILVVNERYEESNDGREGGSDGDCAAYTCDVVTGGANMELQMSSAFPPVQVCDERGPDLSPAYTLSINYMDKNMDISSIHINAVRADVNANLNYGCVQKICAWNKRNQEMQLAQSWLVAYTRECFWRLDIYTKEGGMYIFYVEKDFSADSHIALKENGDLIYSNLLNKKKSQVIAKHVCALSYSGYGQFIFKKQEGRHVCTVPILFNRVDDKIQVMWGTKEQQLIDTFCLREGAALRRNKPYTLCEFLQNNLPKLSGFNGPKFSLERSMCLKIQYANPSSKEIWVLNYGRENTAQNLVHILPNRKRVRYALSRMHGVLAGVLRAEDLSVRVRTKPGPSGSIVRIQNLNAQGKEVLYTECSAPTLWRDERIFNCWFYQENCMGLILNMAESLVRVYYEGAQITVDYIEDAFCKKTRSLLTYPLPTSVLTHDTHTLVSFVSGEPGKSSGEKQYLRRVCCRYTGSDPCYNDRLFYGDGRCLCQWERELLADRPRQYLTVCILDQTVESLPHKLQFGVDYYINYEKTATLDEFSIEVSEEWSVEESGLVTHISPPWQWSMSICYEALKLGVCQFIFSLNQRPSFLLNFFYTNLMFPPENKEKMAQVGWELKTCGDQHPANSRILSRTHILCHDNPPKKWKKRIDSVMLCYKEK